ncbi:CubicO group peptidase (beta-lactamase class C family) [Altererythrobacter atlanticus]|uniref:6-aminohexanoate-dimer hydrolase n=1 Tax=Croceibacterium atlanticum TaxID=1267766 RepID=A0A0F7KSK3_9SPHN|nr:serine hydrolase [Croceibacterium atlanticum]AKH43388.1 6-aminohexanoate-dimer hydrolase [Croceibacterium atlanticum]MBB5731905.1 CubicO group peptidase (beta-lactamase class C family) [Croceibacterium atlanticum]
MTRPFKINRFPSRAAALLPALLPLLLVSACKDEGPPAPPPVPPEVLATVAEEPGTDREDLARAVDALFTRDDIGETRALIVMHAGEVAAERYGGEYGPETKFLGWSMSKTVTGVLMGMMVADGRLRLDDSPPIPSWQRAGDPRGEITLRQLLQMRSGLRHQEKAEPVYTSDEVRMMFLDGRDDMAAWAEAQPLEHEPGREFDYSTASATILSDIGARVLAPEGSADKRQAAMDDFLHARLGVPLGMKSLTAEYDRAGTMVGGSMIWATAPDWARFGEFLRHGGSVKGAQIVPRGWIDFMKSESPRAPDYGATLWLNRDSGTDREMLFPESGPESLFAAIGHLGQYVLVSPSQKLTVVRLGKTDEEDRAALVDALAEIVALYP